MPYKRPDSSMWQISKRLPGYGPTGVLATGVKDKRVAVRMETALLEIAEKAITDPRYKQLLDALVSKNLTLLEVMAAKAERRLDSLTRSLSDPLLVDAFSVVEFDRTSQHGVNKVIEWSGEEARLSKVCTPTSILECLRYWEGKGMKRNSVRRQVYRVLSKLLRHHLGKAERDSIFAEVDYTSVDDTREVVLTREEISLLLESCKKVSFELYVFVFVALMTGADRGVLLKGFSNNVDKRGLLVKDVTIFKNNDRYYGELSLLHDSKTVTRSRTISIGHNVAELLIPLCLEKSPVEPVFSVSWAGIDYLWHKARALAKLDTLRIKDLRAQFAIYADKAGVATATISRSMGHKHEAMTARYQRHDSALSNEDVDRIESYILQKGP